MFQGKEECLMDETVQQYFLKAPSIPVNYFLIKLFFVEIANLGVELRKSGYVDEKPLSKELGIQGVEKDFGKFKLTVL